ncbi:formate dehydrogenase accessory sulfurtransferase FdhD, partial [Vibrio anguillarum]
IKQQSRPKWLSSDVVIALPNLLLVHQPLFAKTGAVHGAGYFVNGELIAVAEDVGRHNAVDKLIGRILNEQRWHPQGVLILSGRVSFELMQKAAIAGISVVVAVGAPSRLALDMARQFDMTLIGFIKKNQFNIYHGHARLQSVKE